MDTYLIKKDTITEIANNVRALMGTSEQLTTEGINNAIILEKESVDLALEMLANKGVEVPEGSRSDSLAELIQSFDGSGSSNFPYFEYTGQMAPVIDDGIIDGIQNWRIKFLTTGTLTFKKDPGIIDAFLVGGGGGGGFYDGGGGGGGYTTTVSLKLEANTPYEIIIGGGGEGAASADVNASNGGITSIAGYSVNGGKAGQNRPSNVSAWGGDGGSGGGCGGADSQHGGAGGSDGSDGVTGWTPKEGKGQGTTTREFGEPEGQLYAGGGGGGSGKSASAGGAGGGGNGGYDSANLMAEVGETNTGGGGGGGSDAGTWRVGAAGGSGIVVIRNHREVSV